MATKSLLKTPKGTRDWVGGDLLLGDQILCVLMSLTLIPHTLTDKSIRKTITTILERHGGIPLDTPVFELRSILSQKSTARSPA